MASVLTPDLQQSLLSLGQLNVDVWYRTLLLSVSGIESFGQRLQRLQNHCRSVVLEGFFQPSTQECGSRADGNPREVIAACTDAYMEEVRNCEQVALITCEEMEVWLGAYVKEWRNLAKSTLTLPAIPSRPN